MVRSESESPLVSQHEAEMVNKPHQLPVLIYDLDFPKESWDTAIFKSPVSELDPLQRWIESRRTGSGLAFQFIDCEVINIDRYRSSLVSEKETIRERYASVKDHQEPSTASSEPFRCTKLSARSLPSTGVQNRYLRSKTDTCFKITCGISSVLAWNFCQHRSGGVHMQDIDRTQEVTSAVTDSELFDVRTRSLCQCKLGRVHMLDAGRSVEDGISAVNDSELFDARTCDLCQCKPGRVHTQDVDRTEDRISVVNDSELFDAEKNMNLYQCKRGRLHMLDVDRVEDDDETVVAMSDGELFHIQLSLIFRLPILLALISKSITTVLKLIPLTSSELLLSETVHLFLLADPQCSEKLLHRCIASVFNSCRPHVWPQCRETGVLQRLLRFPKIAIFVSSITKEIESNHITPTVQQSVLLPEKHPHPSAVKVHRQQLLDVCSVWYNSLSIVLLSVLLSSSCLLVLLTLGKLRLTWKLLLAELKSHDVVYLLVVALLLVTWLQLIPAASLTRTIYKPVKLFSSKTITIVIVTLSCYVKVTDSAPLHLPNLLTRGTAGGNGTYIVPLQGSPNTGYCAKITIGLKPYPQEVFLLIAQKTSLQEIKCVLMLVSCH